MELQQQRRANTRFGSRKADGENVHHLTIGLAPVASGDHEGQRGGVNHDFQTDQHKQQIAADNQTGQTQNE